MSKKLEVIKAKAKFGRVYRKYRKTADGTRIYSDLWTVRYKGIDYATGENDPKAAETFLLRLAADLTKPVPAPAPGTIHLGVPSRSNPKGATVADMNDLFDARDTNALIKKNATAESSANQIALHLRPFFGNKIAADVTSDDVTDYIEHRLDEEAAAASINMELAWLKRSFKIAWRSKPRVIDSYPYFEMLDVTHNVREGFVEHDAYPLLRDAMPDHLRPVFVVAYFIGCRRGELLQIKMRDVDMRRGEIRISASTTKNSKARTIPILAGEMAEVLRRQVEVTRRDYPACPWLFHGLPPLIVGGATAPPVLRGIPGEKLTSFYKAWKTTTKSVGFPDLMFHDLRRTAVRNLIRGGVDRKVAMSFSGHKTEAMFARYDITDGRDISEAAKKMNVYYASLNAEYMRDIEAA